MPADAVHLDLRLAVGAAPLLVQLRSEARTIGIVGPSGAGKSTILRVLAGLERRAVGEVRVGGETWQDRAGAFVPAWRRRVGWVPQDGVLFPHLSVAENLGYAARMPVAEIAALLDIGPLLARPPRNLSGGERQRVALGRALCSAPRLLLLDEPLSALDRPLRARVAAAVARHATERGLAMVLVSHDDADLAAMVEETWEITAGVLQRR
jgi:molybdate transport system ATP-binding protein